VRLIVARQQLQHPVGEKKGGEAERQVDPENERPVQMLGEEAAERRPGDRRCHEDRREIGLVAAPVAGRDHVADDGLAER